MDILSEIDNFYSQFDGEKQILGKSFLGRNVYCFCLVATKRPVVICQYAIHAREHITALLCLEHIKRFNKHKKCGCVYFIPTINPDGINVATTKHPLYKANGRGVDLNVNFDARWGKGKGNSFVLGEQNYVGKSAFSEIESVILRDFTLKVQPDATISYHAKGQEIYYEFFQNENQKQRDFLLAKAISKSTGYKIKSTPDSCGGYKDWCISALKIPALTIEVGSDRLCHPIGKEHLGKIYKKTKYVAEITTAFLRKNYER